MGGLLGSAPLGPLAALQVLPSPGPAPVLECFLCSLLPQAGGSDRLEDGAGASGGYGLRPTTSLVVAGERAVPSGEHGKNLLALLVAGGQSRPGAKPARPPGQAGESQPASGERNRGVQV